MPVFVINGFLEAGKTQFITNTLQQDYFQADGTTVLILCEEGDTEYDKEILKKTNYKTDKLPVQMDYLDDIDIAEFKEIPTYKRMCICILKNDHVCKYMGFALTKKEKLRRDRVMQKYKNIIK